jgi:predicted aminopeptidase
MKGIIQWGRVLNACLFFAFCVFIAVNFRITTYLVRQAAGQLKILTGTVSTAEYLQNKDLPRRVRENLLLVNKLKAFTVDSLGYKPTGNFERIYDQRQQPILWVVGATGPFDLEPYEWRFPVVGSVSYKGFFDRYLAAKEFIGLTANGYDASVRSVSAWSTLGWFNDPLLSNALFKTKGDFCDLIFHELFHASSYVPGDVNLNENLANFIAHKATRKFLANDPVHLREYLALHSDRQVYKNFLLRQYSVLQRGYTLESDKEEFKKRTLLMIADSIGKLPLKNRRPFEKRKRDVLRFRNAYFVDLRQYESLQDSLENVFNKIYRGDIKNMVQHLILN